jgi:electron transport complex protein RnfD
MTATSTTTTGGVSAAAGRRTQPPLLRGPETAGSIFRLTLAAACAPLVAGCVLFGWRALWVAALCVGSCALIEHIYFRVTKAPALLGRSHAYLTGLLLALTLPAFVPWYVPVVASAFAIIIGKGVFGGVGHFLWQPALVGRVAVAVLFPAVLSGPVASSPGCWPVLAQDRIIVGDVATGSRVADDYSEWRNALAGPGGDALLMPPPETLLAGLGGIPQPRGALADTVGRTPALRHSSLADLPDVPRAKPALLASLPPVSDLIYGAVAGGIGETCAIAILVAGLWLVYRNFIKWRLPVAFVLAAALVAAVAPINFAGANGACRTIWWPLAAERADVGFVYLCCQLLSGGVLLAAFFLATEMTSRPVGAGGQTLFGAGAGALAMLLRLYVDLPPSLPAYMAVLAMNTFTPVIDALWRPRVFGRKRLWWLRRG